MAIQGNGEAKSAKIVSVVMADGGEMPFSFDFSFLSQEQQPDSAPQREVQREEANRNTKGNENVAGVAQDHSAQPMHAPATQASQAPLKVLSTRIAEERSEHRQWSVSTGDSGADTAQASKGSSGFARAFAHIKETPSYTPPAASANEGKGKTPNPRAVQVSRRQAGNPVLKNIRNVPWEYADITPDYQMGAQTCCLFLSVRYHLLKPKYIYARMEQLQRGYRLRVLLCHVDSEECHKTLEDVHQAAIVNGWTVILAWSPEEAARYLETYQAYEKKQADAIQERVEGDYFSRLTDVLTTIRSVNRTDAATMSSSLGTLASIMAASKERLALCPGIGDKKVQRIYDAFHEPFRTQKKSRVEEPRLTPDKPPQA